MGNIRAQIKWRQKVEKIDKKRIQLLPTFVESSMNIPINVPFGMMHK